MKIKELFIYGNEKDLKSRDLEINIRKELGVEQQLLTKKKYTILNQILNHFTMEVFFINMQDMQEIQKNSFKII